MQPLHKYISTLRAMRPGPDDASTSRASLVVPPKVSQIDAHELDEGLAYMLSERLERAVGNFQSPSSSTDLKPELLLTLKLVLFYLSFSSPLQTASPGARLVNLKLVSSRSGLRPPPRTLLLYLLLHPPLFPSYILARLRTHALRHQWPELPAHQWRRRAWRLIERLETASRAWELAGWVGFLWDGRYPSLLMRALRLQLVPSAQEVTRLVSYEYMNRQLVWSAFTEFLLFAVPLLPSVSLSPRRALSPLTSLLSQASQINYADLAMAPLPLSRTGSFVPTRAHSGPYANLSPNTCPLCARRARAEVVPLDSIGAASGIALPPLHPGQGQKPEADEESAVFVPAQTDCWGGCRWCYYCIGQELHRLAEAAATQAKGGKGKGEEVGNTDKWECLRCGGGVTRAWRLGAE